MNAIGLRIQIKQRRKLRLPACTPMINNQCSRNCASYLHTKIFLHHRQGEIEASHAWIEAYIPGYGWAAYDPTHDRLANENYIKVAAGRDYADIRPVSGTYRGAATRELRVAVKVREATSRATLT